MPDGSSSCSDSIPMGGTPRIQISLSSSSSSKSNSGSMEAAIEAEPGLYKSVRKALKERTLNFKINVECTSLKVSPSGNFLWGGFSDGTLRVWDLSGTFGFEDDDVVASRQKSGLLVNSKLTQGFGAVASQIHARGVHTDLLTTVDISDDAQYVFMGVSRGAVELHAVFVGDLERAVHSQKRKEQMGWRQESNASGIVPPPVKRNILDYLKVYCYSDAKLKGFGACATLQARNTEGNSRSPPLSSYLLLTGKGIKNIHIWKFTPPAHRVYRSCDDHGNDTLHSVSRNRKQSICDPPEDEEDNGVWEQLYDTSTNGNTIVLLGFHRNPQGKLLAVSKSDAQKLRLWDLSFEETEEASSSTECGRSKRPPYHDVANSQQALDIAGGIGVCGGGNMYNEMSIVSLDRPNDPYNHTELYLPSSNEGGNGGAYFSRRQRRGEMKAVVNVATSQRDSSHALLELDDGSLVGYSAGSSSSESIPKLIAVTPESTGIPALPADFWRRCICLANICGVVIAGSSLYNPNTNKGQLVVRALGGLKKPRGSEHTKKKKERKLLKQQQERQSQQQQDRLKLLKQQRKEKEKQEQLQLERERELQQQRDRLKLLKQQRKEKERQEQQKQDRLKLLAQQQKEKERQDRELQVQKEQLRLLKHQQKEKDRQQREREQRLHLQHQQETYAIPQTPSPIHTGNPESSPMAADKEALQDAVSVPKEVPESVIRSNTKTSKQIDPQTVRPASKSTILAVSPSGGLETPLHSTRMQTGAQDESPDSTGKINTISKFLQPKRIAIRKEEGKQVEEHTKRLKSKDHEKAAMTTPPATAKQSGADSPVASLKLKDSNSMPFTSPKPKMKKRKNSSLPNAPTKRKKSVVSENVLPEDSSSSTKSLLNASSAKDTSAPERKRDLVALNDGPEPSESEVVSTALLLTKLAGDKAPKIVPISKKPTSEIATAIESKPIAVGTPETPAVDGGRSKETSQAKSKSKPLAIAKQQQAPKLKACAPTGKPKLVPKSTPNSKPHAPVQQQSQIPSRETLLNERINEQYNQLCAFLKNFTDQSMKLIHARNLRGPIPSALDDRKQLDAFSKLREEHRAAHNFLQSRLLRSAEATLFLLKESRISSEEARTQLRQCIKKFGKILYDTLHRQEMERLALVSKIPKSRSNLAKNRKQGMSSIPSSRPTEEQSNYPCKEAFEKVEHICAAITRPVGRPRSGPAALRG
ncbi:unnamed protein product [Pseudo-nitzschia multistriata]|uniref:Uncharacterized protein n=1 Tax=Pseudo-nitzschia multistriata TaxID=183589 RepID=A0A448YY21_9STRA|nr:unnamed protein product [Pseudo-nitzschia multistriata]